MPRLRPAPFASILALALTAAWPPAQAAGGSTIFLPLVARDFPPTFAQRVVALTNQERAQAGCGPLAINARLTLAAQNHSTDMALNDFFGHVGSGGSTLSSRLNAVGYTFWAAAENIAAGYPTPESAVAGWMSSPGHRNNILNCNYTEIGVGYDYLANDTGNTNYSHYWTQDFGRPR